MPAPQPVAQDFTQPAIPIPKSGWAFNCIDLQIITKSDGWNQGSVERALEYQEIAKTGCNYVSLAVPYDNLTKFTNYVNDARTAGFKISSRSHWNDWQGDNGAGTVTSITQSGGAATVTVPNNGTNPPHPYYVGAKVVISGASIAAYNGEFTV